MMRAQLEPSAKAPCTRTMFFSPVGECWELRDSWEVGGCWDRACCEDVVSARDAASALMKNCFSVYITGCFSVF